MRTIPAVLVLGVVAAPWAAPTSFSAPAATGTCPEGMVRIEAGSFEMGSPAGEGTAEEHPLHTVTLSAYCIDRTEVTVAAYEACAAQKACPPAPGTVYGTKYTDDDEAARWNQFCNRSDRRDHPINCVDWTQADAYCRSHDKRLPTEAEWEYAARGTDGRGYPWGDEPPDATRVNACGTECVVVEERELQRGWTAMYDGDDGAVSTAPVGSYPAGASPFGVLDMAGNVWEWTADWYAAYTDVATTDPRSPAVGKYRVTRGGGWGVGWSGKKATVLRGKNRPTSRNVFIGFRCARTR